MRIFSIEKMPSHIQRAWALTSTCSECNGAPTHFVRMRVPGKGSLTFKISCAKHAEKLAEERHISIVEKQ